MKPLSSAVSPWTLLVFIALLRDTQAETLCANNCSADAVTTTTTTSITFESDPTCNISTSDKLSQAGSITGLTPGKVYNVTVHCSNCCKVVTTKPARITGLSTNVTTSSIFVTWTKPVGESSSYRVQWTGGVVSETDTTTEPSKDITDLTAGAQYTITVTAVSNAVEGEGFTVHLYTKPKAVSNLSVTEVTTSSVHLNWTQPEGNSSYYRVKWTDGVTSNNVTVNETNKNITGLTSGVRYDFTVQSVAEDHQTESDMQEIHSFTKPKAVSNLSVAEVTTSSVHLNWTQPEGNSSYYRVKWTDGVTNKNVTVNETNKNVTGLTPGVRYDFTVQSVAEDHQTESDMQEIHSYTKPKAVSNFSVTEVTTSSVHLNWTQPEGNSSYYRVKWTDGVTSNNVTVNETNKNITGLTSGVRYDFTVQSVAEDHQTESDMQEIHSFTKPKAVSKLSVAEVTTSSVHLNWTEPEGNSSYYRVKWTDGVTSNNVTVNETNKNVTGLTSGVRYDFTVQSVAGDHQTESDMQEIHCFTKPKAVSNLSVAEVTTSSVHLNWTQPEGNSSYFRVKWTDGVTNNRVTVSETNVNITGLTPGVRYDFTVQSVAEDHQTESDMQEIHSFTKPKAVSNLSVTEVTTSSVHLNWTQPEGNSSYFRVKWTDGVTSNDVTVSETNVNITGLTPGVRYDFTVQSVAEDHQTESDMQEIHSYTRPEKLRNIMPTDQGTDYFTITWTLLHGQSDYFLVRVSNSSLMDLNVSSDVLSANITKLLPGRVYDVSVTSVAGEFRTRSDEVPIATRPTPPGAIEITGRSNSSLQLRWSTPKKMEGLLDIHYNITYLHNGGGIQVEKTTDENITLSSLTSGTSYSLTVETVGPQSLRSSAVHNSSFTLPNPVLNLTARPINTTTVTVEWSDPLGVQSYYEYLVETFNDLGTLVSLLTVSDKSINVSNLEPGSRYTISVTTICGGEIQSSTEQTFSYSVPKAVTNLTVENVQTTSIQLTWLQQNDYKPSYVYHLLAFLDGEVTHNDSTKNETYTFSSLHPGALYNFQVFAVVADVRSTMESIQLHTIPEGPSVLTAIGSTTSLAVSWRHWSSRVSTYSALLYRGDHSVENKTDLSNVTFDTEFVGLEPGVEYRVVLVTKSGPHENNSEVCSATFPNPPGPITVQSQTIESINFTWTFPVNMNRGQCSFSVSTAKGSFPTENTWYLLDNLQSGSPYNITVVTVGVRSYKSTEVSAENYTRPHHVTNLRPTEITTGSVTLLWEQPESKAHFSYLVQVSNSSASHSLTERSTTNTTVIGLQSGSNFSFTVTTQTADGTQAEAVTESYFTRPYGVKQPRAETLNSTDIRLDWTKPLEYKSYYKYWVAVSGCAFRNKTFSGETVVLSELVPGTNCTFCVSVEAQVIRGEEICISQYTMPEKAQPTVSSRGSNSSILVTWSKPEGEVERYQVFLNSSTSGSDESVQLNSSELDGNRTEYLFGGLSAGRLYSVMIITLSGPFNATSALQDNATFPNPPGPIEILTKTTRSIAVGWTEPILMADAEFSYKLTINPVLMSGNSTTVSTSSTTHTFDFLPSGTSFDIAVSTVGVLDFESEKAFTHKVTTKPLSVTSLKATAEETNITLNWTKPGDYKSSYVYELTLEESNGTSGDTWILIDTKKTINKLNPGSSYNFSVTTKTSDGTKAKPERTSICTRASPVKHLMYKSPNEAIAKILLTWEKPEGEYSGFEVILNDVVLHSNTCCSHNVSNLQHYKNYTVSVKTLSCGEPSTLKTRLSQTGITNPPIRPNFEQQVEADPKAHNRFSIGISLGLLNNTNGPITHVGVLVRKSVPDGSLECSDYIKYLGKTYEEWRNKASEVYLATVTKTDVLQSDSGQELSIDIGDEVKWEGYFNGALEASTKYEFAIVLFTKLMLKHSLVDVQRSLASTTKCIPVELPFNPVVIGIAVGATLGIFCVLFIVLIGFIVYWKRVSNKESPDIQIHSLRTKVSVPVRVEDYEAYFRKQKADSNCGFAEEFEELKPVGTGQSKVSALSLENKPKNRYSNVVPYDSSRVKLSIIHGNPNDDYINANYLPGYNSRKEFIAAQGPLPTTVNAFWRMIWEKNVQTLVMLTRCNEQGRVKCEQYWSLGTKHFENITVTTNSEIPLEDWTIRDFTIKNVTTAETRAVRHFHFTAWPDHGVPETTELLINFRHLVREHMNQYSRNSPTVVHCSAGVGRTGTLISIDRLMFQIERENIVDVYGIVHDLRMHRTLMVQTEDQYAFLNHCALDIIRSRTGTNVDLIYQNVAALSIYENVEPKKWSKHKYQT